MTKRGMKVWIFVLPAPPLLRWKRSSGGEGKLRGKDGRWQEGKEGACSICLRPVNHIWRSDGKMKSYSTFFSPASSTLRYEWKDGKAKTKLFLLLFAILSGEDKRTTERPIFTAIPTFHKLPFIYLTLQMKEYKGRKKSRGNYSCCHSRYWTKPR